MLILVQTLLVRLRYIQIRKRQILSLRKPISTLDHSMLRCPIVAVLMTLLVANRFPQLYIRLLSLNTPNPLQNLWRMVVGLLTKIQELQPLIKLVAGPGVYTKFRIKELR